MSDGLKGDRSDRLLGIYTRLINGGIVNKTEEAAKYNVDERSIQRDIDSIRNFLANDVDESGVINSIIYDRVKKGFRLEHIYKIKLTNSEILAVCKILLESRSLTKDEMIPMLDKLISSCVPYENQKIVKDLIRNEEFHYVEPRHRTKFLDNMWTLGQAIRDCHYIEIDYTRTKDKKTVQRKLKPVAIMFSEYYFYLTAFIDDEKVKKDFDVINDSSPTIYRIDRIKNVQVLDERFHIPYSSRFEEGEFRKRVQFMMGGELQKVKFVYKGLDVDAVLDRLPTANIVDKIDEGYVVQAEVFGKGIDMWLRSQGDCITILN
ncbi:MULTISPECIES: helix-turn-helix transcriptional regulator [unclassified Blautia]|uniref:helix-turn-helix transcriptional regulator n=1 Tax=unclassified Blautia TaxID=2648079 RepID=UPI003F8B1B03